LKVNQIPDRVPNSVRDEQQNFMTTPSYFCSKPSNIKAFVLGCDPTAFNKNKELKVFNKAFGLEKESKNPYFARILSNLKLIGITLNDIYVQNLIPEYQELESSKNKKWMKTASLNILPRKEEFDVIDPNHSIPVFLTSELLYIALIKEGRQKYKAIDFYKNPELVPIPADASKLARPLIPFYRHYSYNLNRYPEYIQRLKALF
jgi:hypothetical protein